MKKIGGPRRKAGTGDWVGTWPEVERSYKEYLIAAGIVDMIFLIDKDCL